MMFWNLRCSKQVKWDSIYLLEQMFRMIIESIYYAAVVCFAIHWDKQNMSKEVIMEVQ